MKFKIGDKVRVKNWKEIVSIYKEHGKNLNDENFFLPYISDIEQYCGEIFTIKETPEWLRDAYYMEEVPNPYIYFEEFTIEAVESFQEKNRKAVKIMRFNVGDMVRVKDWDVLVKEFGYNEYENNIETPCYFLEEMKEFCGKTFTISEGINVKEIRQDINIPDNTFAYYFTNDEDRYYFDECVLEIVIFTNKIRDMVKEIEDMRAQLYQKLDYRMGKVEICHELFSIQYRLEMISHTIAYYENVE